MDEHLLLLLLLLLWLRLRLHTRQGRIRLCDERLIRRLGDRHNLERTLAVARHM